MKVFIKIFKKINYWLNSVSEVLLFLMMMLTVADVILRSFDSPIVGTYELVAMIGALIVGFSVPQTSWDKGHVFVDFMIENRSAAVKNSFFIVTRIIGIATILILSWNLYAKATYLHKTGEVSMTLHVPFYPVAYILSFCFLIEGFTLLTDIFKIFNSGEEK
jgi:TRAP-type C4-dicarboxylate transport system permease small subunit